MSPSGDERTNVPDPEVVPVAKRQQFTSEEKLCMLKEADAYTDAWSNPNWPKRITRCKYMARDAGYEASDGSVWSPWGWVDKEE